MDGEIIIFFVIGIAIAVGLFFLFRLITCWYLKINRRVDLLEQQVRLLTEISNKLDGIIKASGNSSVNQ